MNYAYERVSTVKQDERRQELCMDNIKIDRRYIDKLSGKNADRPALIKLKAEAKAGDHIYCEAISRLGRNVDDLRDLCRYFRDNNVVVHFIKEGFDTSGHMYQFLLTILGAVAEMERGLINDRIREGVASAKINGTKTGVWFGRPAVELPEKFERYYQQFKAGEIIGEEFARLIGKSRSQLYRYIKEYEKKKAG